MSKVKETLKKSYSEAEREERYSFRPPKESGRRRKSQVGKKVSFQPAVSRSGRKRFQPSPAGLAPVVIVFSKCRESSFGKSHFFREIH